MDDIRSFLETDLREYLSLLEKPGVFEVQIVPYELMNGHYEGHVWCESHHGLKRVLEERTVKLEYPAPKSGDLALVKVWQDKIINYEVISDPANFFLALKRVVCYSLNNDNESIYFLDQEPHFKLNEFASYLEKKQYWYKESIVEDDMTLIVEKINNIYLKRLDVTFTLQLLQIDDSNDLPIPQYCKLKTFKKIEKLTCEQIIGNIASAADQKAHKYEPIVEAEIPFYKHRFTGVLEPIAKFPFFVIRKHSSVVKNIEDLVYCDDPVMPEKAMNILKKWIKERRSFLISGAMASGKTTLLNALLKLSNRYNPEDRIGIIEDTPEIICSSENYYAINCSSKIVDNSKLLRTSFRLTPKQVVVGEIRGPEAYEFLDAAISGCECCLATIHGSGALQGVYRFESCLKMNPTQGNNINRTQIAMAIKGIVSIQRINISKEVNGIWYSDKKRRVTSIMNIKGYDPRYDFYDHEFLYQDPELFELTGDGAKVDSGGDFNEFASGDN